MNIKKQIIANLEDQMEDSIEVIVGSDLSRECQVGNIFLLRLKDKTLIINNKGKVKYTIDATKVQPSEQRRVFKKESDPKLLKIEKNNKIWYLDYGKFE